MLIFERLCCYLLIMMSSMYRTIAFTSIQYRRQISSSKLSRFHSSTRRNAALSQADEDFMLQAIALAKKGLGHTFPNPAVGCVLVQNDDLDDNNKLIGAGFHPRAGYPHAEVFALFQAAGHVQNGVMAADSVLQDGVGTKLVQDLNAKYAEDEGPEDLLEDSLADRNVTAYVTLEPCCHYGKTPPCAMALALAGVSRVVVGFRDPNPRVDGGGVKLLEQVGIPVDMARGKLNRACAALVTDFCKRITPREEPNITGGMRRALRALANRKKAEKSLVSVEWGGSAAKGMDVDDLLLRPEWMEHVDGLLWREELILLRLNKAVEKKKAAKLLGERIAALLGAHVAQTVGHTVLLYRPGIPPVLDLEELVAAHKSNE